MSLEANGVDGAVRVRARVTKSDSFRLEVVGTQESFDVAATRQGAISTELTKYVGRIVAVEGIVPAPEGTSPAVIQVRVVKAENGTTP